MASFFLSPAMRELMIKARTQGGTLTPAQIQAMKSSGTAQTGGGLVCDPRAMYAAGHACAKTPQTFVPYIKLSPPQMPEPVQIESTVPLDNGMTKAVIETSTETVTAVVDKSGDIKAVEVKPNKLIPLALLAAGAILLGG